MKPNREAARNIRVLSQTSANQDLNRQSITNHPNYNNNSMNMMNNNANSLFNNSSFAHTSGDASTSLNTRPNNSSSVNKSNAAPPTNQNQMNQTNGFSAAGADNNNKTQTSLSPFSNKNTRQLKENGNYQPSTSNGNPIQLINNSGGIAYPNGQSQQQQQQSLLQEQMKRLKEDMQRKEKIKKMQQDKLQGSIVVGQNQTQNVGQKTGLQQSSQQQQRNSHQHIQQLIIQQQQQQQLQQPVVQQEPKQDFRKEIERRFQRSNVNKTFVFPRKKKGGNQNTISGGDPVDSNSLSSSDTSFDSIRNITVYDLRSQNNKNNNPQRVQRSTTDHSLGGTKPLTSDSPEIKNTQSQNSNNNNNVSISQFNKPNIKHQQLINSSSQQVRTEGDDHSQNVNNSSTVVRTHSSISKPISQYTQQQQAILMRENQQFASVNQKLLGNGVVGQQIQKNDSSLQQPFSQTNGFLSNSNTKVIKRGEIAKSANKSYDHKIQNASTTFTTIQSKSSNSRRPQQSQGFENMREQESISNPRYVTEMSPEKKSNISDFLNSGSIQNQQSINYESQSNNRQHSKSQSGNKLNTGSQYNNNKNQVSLSKNGRQTQNNMRIFQLKNDQLQKIYKSSIKRPEYQQNNMSSDNYAGLRVQTEGSEPANKNTFYNKTQQDIYKKFKMGQIPQQPNQMTQNLFASQQHQIFTQNNITLKKQKLPIL